MPLKVCHWQLRALHSWPVRTGSRGACQTAIKWQMAVVFASYSLRMEGEAIKESIVCGRQQWVSGNSQSMSMLRMAMANDSPNLIRSSAMSDVFIVLFTFLVYFWLVTCTSEWSDPHGFFAKWSSLALPLLACSNLSACGIFCLTHSKFSYN